MARDDKLLDGAPPRPSLPKRAREGVTIDGQFPDASRWTASPAGAWGRLALAAVAGAVAASVGLWWLAPLPDLEPLSRRLTALEAASPNADLAQLKDAQQSLTQRLAKTETQFAALPDLIAKLGDRVAALERAPAPDPGVAPLRADFDAAKAQTEALTKRLTDLEGVALKADALAPVVAEARAPKPDPRVDEIAPKVESNAAAETALQARLDKIEAALAAPKAQTRAPASLAPPTLSARPASVAVAALALRQRFAAREPLAQEIAALAALGADETALAPLRPFADHGAPTLAELRRDFERLTPQMQTPSSPPKGGAVDRLWSEMQGLVKVRKLGDSRPSDTAAADVDAALARGDLDAAIEVARGVPGADAWREAAQARRDAQRACDSLFTSALASLGGR